MHPDQMYSLRTQQHTDLLAEVEAEARARRAEAAHTSRLVTLWHWLAAWLRRPARRSEVRTR